MDHPRKLIRAAIVSRLKEKAADGTPLTMAGDNVEGSRIVPLDDENCPMILVYTREEKIDDKDGYDLSGSDSWRRRGIVVVIEGFVAGGLEVDDRLDDIAGQIEAAIDPWEIPGFESAEIRLLDTTIDVITEGVRKPVGAIGLNWHVDVRTPWRLTPDDINPVEVRRRAHIGGEIVEEDVDLESDFLPPIVAPR